MPSALVYNGADGPVAKRQKLSNGHIGGKTAQGSRIFTPFRKVGLVSPTNVPFTSIPLGKTTFQITTSVGRCLQTYDLKRGLNLVFLTRPQTPEDITAVLAWKDRIFAAWCGELQGSRPGLWIFNRGRKSDELAMPDDLEEPIKEIIVFGAWIVACCSTRVEVWRSTTYEHYTTIYSTIATKDYNELTRICCMPTCLNKVFVGRRDGSIEIWNVSTSKLVYTILPPYVDCGSVVALQPAPALSLMAIAYSKGPLVIHDIRVDKTLISLHSDSSVTSISFRTDGLGAGEDGRKSGVMATAGLESGDVTFWDLNGGGRIMGVLRGAHNPPSEGESFVAGGVTKIEFLTGQPVIITSGLDNSLRSWIFDESPYSPIPRTLHSRSGHAAPVTRLQFLPSEADGADATGKWLLSGSKDRSLWGWSLRRDGQSTELSQGNIRKKAKKLGILAAATLANEPTTTLEDLKAPEIICIASSLNRDGGMGAFAGNGAIWQKGSQSQRGVKDATESAKTGWESIVTGHRGDKYARTWFWGKKKAGRWALETGDGGNVQSVAVSSCGNFAVVGSEFGAIDMFNLQSGQHRLRFPPKLTPGQAKKLKIQQYSELDGGLEDRNLKKFHAGQGKHAGAVTGLVVDSLNRTLISCSLDGKIKFWNFSTGILADELDWHPMSGVTGIRYYAASDLIALSCDDLSIRVVDTETKKTIREFWGCKESINDFCFSNDGRWILAAAQDSIIRIWDLPTGHLIDAMRMDQPCVALAFSGTGEFLATAAAAEIGVSIWSNQTLFKHVPTRQISEDEIANVSVPTASGEGGVGPIEGAFDEEEEQEDDSVPLQSADQLSDQMMTLSLVPKSRWQTLIHLDVIKQRNKPKEPPKVPEKAPFFLPSLGDAKGGSSSIVEASKTDIIEKSRIIKMDRVASEGVFTRTLREGRESKNYDQFILHLKTLSPSAADLEIRSLSPAEECNELAAFVDALTYRLTQKRDYELVQAWLNVFLRLHADAVSRDAELAESLIRWRDEQQKEATKLGDLIGYCSGLIGFLRSPRV